MRFAFFVHSLVSDWNHRDAHFLRGVMTELVARGHEVRALEPADAWSVRNLVHDHGARALVAFHAAYPQLASLRYGDDLALDEVLDGVDVVIAHEWNEPALIRRLGAYRAQHPGTLLLFHDTHHRSITAPDEMVRYDLSRFDGVLALGGVIRERYLARGWAARAWTWHEAADVRVFAPSDEPVALQGDLVWIGNWGDEERAAQLDEMLIEPVRALGLSARTFGVRYPVGARIALADAGIAYGGWLPNFLVPRAFARHAVTIHVPRRPYAEALPGVPTIRPFEALACGIPLVSAPWHDADGLFTAGVDYLVARTGAEMRAHLRAILADGDLAASLAAHGRRTILARHTCAHRVDELLAIVRELRGGAAWEAA